MVQALVRGLDKEITGTSEVRDLGQMSSSPRRCQTAPFSTALSALESIR